MIQDIWSQRDLVISSLKWGAPVQQTPRSGHVEGTLAWKWFRVWSGEPQYNRRHDFESEKCIARSEVKHWDMCLPTITQRCYGFISLLQYVQRYQSCPVHVQEAVLNEHYKQLPYFYDDWGCTFLPIPHSLSWSKYRLSIVFQSILISDDRNTLISVAVHFLLINKYNCFHCFLLITTQQMSGQFSTIKWLSPSVFSSDWIYAIVMMRLEYRLQRTAESRPNGRRINNEKLTALCIIKVSARVVMVLRNSTIQVLWVLTTGNTWVLRKHTKTRNR